MRLFAVGLSHRTAPVSLRESVDFARSGLNDALAALAARGISREVVVLSTCNRAEIYAAGGTDATPTARRVFHDYLRYRPGGAHLSTAAAPTRRATSSRRAGSPRSSRWPQILAGQSAYSSASDLRLTARD